MRSEDRPSLKKCANYHFPQNEMSSHAKIGKIVGTSMSLTESDRSVDGDFRVLGSNLFDEKKGWLQSFKHDEQK